MKLDFVPLVFLGFASTLALTHCEPADEAPAPTTPASPPPQPGDVPPPPAGPPGAEGAAPSSDEDGTQYASGEYNVGEDEDTYDDEDPAALSDFHDELAPHGQWVDDPTYGTVWVPAPTEVGTDFQPYVSAGHWTYDDDWTWVSDYGWGWAPFHYGRWVVIEGRGWSWIPGRAYRGAWVVWGVDDGFGYLGWAPLPPTFIWWHGGAVGWHGPYVRPRWSYCPRTEIFAPRVATRVVVGAEAVPVAARMHVYVSAQGRVGMGPSPARLGYAAAQIPHATGPTAGGVARAQQFSRPSTATPLGAHTPTRVAPVAAPLTGYRARPMTTAPAGAPRYGGSPGIAPRPGGSPGVAPRYGGSPGVAPRSVSPQVVPHVAPPRAAPSFHGGGHFGGGGHHR